MLKIISQKENVFVSDKNLHLDIFINDENIFHSLVFVGDTNHYIFKIIFKIIFFSRNKRGLICHYWAIRPSIKWDFFLSFFYSLLSFSNVYLLVAHPMPRFPPSSQTLLE